MKRRQFIQIAAGATGGYALGLLAPRAGASQSAGTGVVSTDVRGSIRVGSLTVEPGRTLRFDPSYDTKMELTGNLVVEGTLEMRPDPGVTHTLRFVGIDESRFVGGGMEVIDSDVGLWVMGRGRLDIHGEPRAGWNRSGTHASWRKFDEIRTTPFAPGDTSTFAPYSGTLDSVTAPDGRTFTQEAFNLTRSVMIEGTAGGRAHIFIHSSARQSIRYAAIRWVGPRKRNGHHDDIDSVLGRYGLHFHMCDDGSRGSHVVGVIVRDCGGHAFVPHNSHGVTFRDCIAFNANEDAYWWDRGKGMATDDTLYDHCLAAGLVPIPRFRGYTLSGFNLPDGKNNSIVDSVAVGNQGNKTASGFQWQSGTKGRWLFRDCVAHNNKSDGIFVWQNNSNHHVIRDFVAFQNGVGIQHGAYTNAYRYKRCMTFDNATGLLVNARSSRYPKGQLRWQSCNFSDGVAIATSAKNDADQPALIVDSACASVVVDERKSGVGAYDFIRCGLHPTDWTVVSMHPGSVYRAQSANGTAYRVNADGSTTSITPFAR